MKHNNRPLIGALLAASCLVVPQAAVAATDREAQLEARLERLEAEMRLLRADLASARQEQAESAAQAQDAIAAATGKSEEATAKVAAIESRGGRCISGIRPTVSDPGVPPRGRLAQFMDPEGNIIEICQVPLD